MWRKKNECVFIVCMSQMKPIKMSQPSCWCHVSHRKKRLEPLRDVCFKLRPTGHWVAKHPNACWKRGILSKTTKWIVLIGWRENLIVPGFFFAVISNMFFLLQRWLIWTLHPKWWILVEILIEKYIVCIIFPGSGKTTDCFLLHLHSKE